MKTRIQGILATILLAGSLIWLMAGPGWYANPTAQTIAWAAAAAGIGLALHAANPEEETSSPKAGSGKDKP
ncbi:hypothetical protein [Bifidobacterium pseudolongum]|uniref:Uncharacterized protein n=1 Tax=Bifidobacterium pseudolongum subsp. globosum TaxID=1690 RepID=A0A4Q5AT48_9BIFI|nr:hypothetical protein [Bifidobacterium pseudolongum]RYQ36317.1 hypothetical protein PG2003B_1154 [Bifidobacterium pseudolongum subsp. globosum]